MRPALLVLMACSTSLAAGEVEVKVLAPTEPVVIDTAGNKAKLKRYQDECLRAIKKSIDAGSESVAPSLPDLDGIRLTVRVINNSGAAIRFESGLLTDSLDVSLSGEGVTPWCIAVAPKASAKELADPANRRTVSLAPGESAEEPFVLVTTRHQGAIRHLCVIRKPCEVVARAHLFLEVEKGERPMLSSPEVKFTVVEKK